jgi:hypothetical protein
MFESNFMIRKLYENSIKSFVARSNAISTHGHDQLQLRLTLALSRLIESIVHTLLLLRDHRRRDVALSDIRRAMDDHRLPGSSFTAAWCHWRKTSIL